MGILTKLILIFSLITVAGGCAGKSLVALAPDPDGKTGGISVGNEAGSISIDKPYHAVTVGNFKVKPGMPVDLGKESLDKTFAEALSIQPKRPLHILLYFEKDIALTSDSINLLPEIIAAIRERNSSFISVIGHTDTVGSRDYNTALSNKRATAVKDLLVKLGADSNTILITSHGKENPLIPTADNVNEPRNRRVEVIVR
jgi:outer membrane protein OmpA-like peptidoglycan-associated protein